MVTGGEDTDAERHDSTTGRTTRSQRRVSRRKLLAALGAGSVALAGCSGGDGGGTDPPGTTGPTDTTGPTGTQPPGTQSPASTAVRRSDLGAPVEPVFDVQSVEKPTDDWDHSPYQSTISTQDNPIYVTLTPYGANAGHPELDYEPLLMEENELIDGKVWRHKIADGFTWHDGTDVTIEDRYNRVKYDELRREKYGNERDFESVELVDDRTMEITLHSKQHPIAFLSSNRPSVEYQSSLYKPHLESMQDAGTKRAAYLTHQDFVDVSIPPEEWVGNSLWQISDIGENRVIYDRYEDYPEEHAQYQNIEQLRVSIMTGRSGWILKIRNDQTDWINGVDKPMANAAESQPGYRVPRKKTTKQYAFRLNHNNKHLKRLGVRRAIAYIKRFGVALDGDPGHYADTVQDGTTDSIREQWMPNHEERVSQYINYGTEGKLDAAAAELRGEGYSKEGGTWVGPDGDELEVDVSTPWWFQPRAQTLVSWLQQFGFTSRVKEPNMFWSTYASYEKDWDIIVGFHTRGPNHPTSSYKNDDHWGIKMTEVIDGERSAVGNRDLEYELPTDLGATDLSGDTRTVNIAELQAQISDPEATAEDYVEPLKTLSWWWNYYVPDLIAVGGYYNFLGDYGNYEWLDWNGDGEGDATNAYEFAYGINTGYIHGREA
mgnify:CR=1 FL=1